MKRALLLAGLVVTLFHCPFAAAQTQAQEVRTEWTPIAKSMTALLNEGWRITAHGNSSPSYSFVLTKESKAVICIIVVDFRVNDVASRCRALN